MKGDRTLPKMNCVLILFGYRYLFVGKNKYRYCFQNSSFSYDLPLYFNKQMLDTLLYDQNNLGVWSLETPLKVRYLFYKVYIIRIIF